MKSRIKTMKVIHITQDQEWEAARQIRKEVFVIEQKVPETDEYDEFEETSRHFLALDGDAPVGTARWRFTEKGAKLERFAVSKEARGKGVGTALVRAVIDDIKKHSDDPELELYLHSQVSAVGLYAKFGFKPKGDQFDECGIMHYRMSQKLKDLGRESS